MKKYLPEVSTEKYPRFPAGVLPKVPFYIILEVHPGILREIASVIFQGILSKVNP